MPRVFLSSIRFKILVLYFLVLFLTLSLFNFFVYLDFKETQERRIDALLDVKVQAVESAVRTHWQTQAQAKAQAAALAVQPKQGWFSELLGARSANGGAASSRPSAEEPYDVIIRYLTLGVLSPGPADAPILIDVFDADGRLTDSSRPENIRALNPAVLRRVRDGRKIYYSFKYEGEAGKHPMRAVAKAILEGSQTKIIVQARVPTHSLSVQMQSLLLKLFFLQLMVALLASGGSLLLVHSTLEPVDQMTRMIRSIKPDSLDRRVHVPKTGDEIARLGETFNAMLERLEKSFVTQKQIIQDISHELKTPLTIIRGQIEVSLKRKRTPEEYEEVLRSSLEEVEKVRKIIDNLLLLAKFDNPSHALEMFPVDIHPILLGIAQDAQLLGSKNNIEVTLEGASTALAYGNEVHLERLFRNLVENAVKYNVPRGRVNIRVEDGKGMTQVTVEDTGQGIPAHEIGRIFDRFYRVDRARSSGDGFGLGLSICKSIVDAHHGRIEVGSEMGKGTAFQVRLPKSALGQFFQATGVKNF